MAGKKARQADPECFRSPVLPELEDARGENHGREGEGPQIPVRGSREPEHRREENENDRENGEEKDPAQAVAGNQVSDQPVEGSVIVSDHLWFTVPDRYPA